MGWLLGTEYLPPHQAPAWAQLIWAGLWFGAAILTLWSATRYSEAEYRSVKASKSWWLAIVLLGGWIGTAAFFLGPHRRLRKTTIRL